MNASVRIDHLDENAALALVDGSLGSLGSPQRNHIERHLESCDGCRELVAELARGFDDEQVEQESSPDTDRLPFAAVAAVTHGGRYRVEHEIGSGSAGTVYRARDERTREIVALKIVTDPLLSTRFAREANALSRIEHPAIVRYISHGETTGGMYLAMEWLDGEDLEQQIRRGPLGWQAARMLGVRLAGALAHAHRLGLVHRDLSPRNVFLPHGRIEAAKLLDFGLVRMPDEHTLERTASQAILGTPYYMAPEQVRDPKNVDARADLFGLGVLLYEATCGRRPFDGADLFSLWVNIVDAAPQPLASLAPGTPASFLAIVDALLAKDPAGRPGSADVVERALLALDEAHAPTAPLARPISSARQTPPPMTLASAPYASAPPPWSPPPPHYFPQAATVPPPQPAPPPSFSRSAPTAGIFMAAGAGIMSLVAGIVFIVYALTHPSRTHDDPAPVPIPSPPSDPAPEPHAAVVPPEQETPHPAQGGVQMGGRLVCGGRTLEERGQTYAPEISPLETSVVIGEGCQATLEDCTIRGQNSVMIGQGGTLTLRHCTVQGSVLVLGPTATLIVERTTLGALKNNGGHVVFK